MNKFERALIYVMANKGKSALVFIIFFVTMAAVSTGYLSKKMYDNTLEDTFADGTVPVYLNFAYPETMMGDLTNDWRNDANISNQNYYDIAELEQVDSSDISMSSNIYLEDLVLPDASRSYGLDALSVSYVDDPKDAVSSYYSDAYTFDYDKDEYKGEENTIILNDQLLEVNDLKVGDTITLDMNSSYIDTEPIEELNAVEFTIVGSYSVEPTQEMIDKEKSDAETYDYEPDLDFGYLYTDAYMPNKVGVDLINTYNQNGQNGDDAIWTNGTYNLTSLDVVDSFKADAEAITGFPIKVQYSTDSDAMEGLELIEYIKDFIKYFLVAGIVVVVVLLTVIITLFIRGRKKELGILVALGESKKNIFIQLVTEQAIILAAATILSYPICFITLQIAANKFAFSSSFAIMPLIYSILTGIVIVALITIIPTIYTLRLKPKKILL